MLQSRTPNSLIIFRKGGNYTSAIFEVFTPKKSSTMVIADTRCTVAVVVSFFFFFLFIFLIINNNNFYFLLFFYKGRHLSIFGSYSSRSNSIAAALTQY